MARSSSFSELVTCVVINLDSRPDRWRRTQFLCHLQGIDPVRFEAHDGDRGRAEYPDSPLSPGELGLWSSFTTVVRSHVETEWILVLEDDAILLPGFRRHAKREIDRANADVVAIRMGWLGPFVWRHGMRMSRYPLKVAKKVIRRLQHTARRGGRGGRPLKGQYLWGTQALLIRRCHVDRMLHSLGEATTALDHAFNDVEWSDPGSFRRARRNRVWQWPDPSSIQ